MLYWICLASVLTAQTPLTLSVGGDAAEPVRFAAEELSRHIIESTGIKVELLEDAALSSSNVLLLAIPRQDAPALQFPQSSHEEAYRIYMPDGGGRVFTANTPRALLYAVYDFLETALNYRWYFPYPEDNLTPSISPAAFNRLLQTVEDRETEPAFPFRSREFRDVAPTTEKTDDLIVHQIDWWAKLRMNRFLLNFNYASNSDLWARWQTRILPEIKRRGMLVGLGEHGSYPLFLPPHRYAQDHPEWYCEIDGKRIGAMHTESGAWAQFCTTNPDAVATYLENFADFVREHPEVDFYYPAPNDIGLWCECATCRDIPVPDRYMQLNNQVAEKLNTVKPGTRVMHLAYSNHSLPPENTQPHPMIDVDVAVWGRDFSYPLCDPRTMTEDPEYRDLFRNWAALCRRNSNGENARLLYHWKIMRHYWLGLHLTPLPVIDEDFNCIREIDIDGFDLPLAYLGIWTKALNAYVVANKTWEPELSAAALTRRFMADYYGEHAETAQHAYELVAEAFRDKRYGRSLTLAWFPDTSKVRAEPLEGLGDNAGHAVTHLDEALALAEPLLDTPPPLSDRFRKLYTVMRHARDEQRVLVALDALMQECHAYRQEESEAMRIRALESWDKAKDAADALAAAYSREENEAGLYWGGASYKQLQDALARWRLLLEAADWRKIGEWETENFNNSTAPVTRRFDVTDALREKLPGLVQVRFKYTGGELGASLRGATLLQQDDTGKETPLAEDGHGGFAGYIHENAVYRMNVETTPQSAVHYILEVELAAYATSGSVAERGCKGDIFLGLPIK